MEMYIKTLSLSKTRLTTLKPLTICVMFKFIPLLIRANKITFVKNHLLEKKVQRKRHSADCIGVEKRIIVSQSRILVPLETSGGSTKDSAA